MTTIRVGTTGGGHAGAERHSSARRILRDVLARAELIRSAVRVGRARRVTQMPDIIEMNDVWVLFETPGYGTQAVTHSAVGVARAIVSEKPARHFGRVAVACHLVPDEILDARVRR